MPSILFFAKLREQLGCKEVLWQELGFEANDHVSIQKIRSLLMERFPQQAELLQPGQSLAAINQALVNDEQRQIGGSDELAFFPPMTGG